MNLRGTASREEPEINFIPLIDVLLVILIFLMVTTTYQRVAELQITLPEADADAAKQRPQEINIGIDAQGRYVIDKNVFTFTTVPALADALRRAAGDAKDPVIIINADANATHQSVINVMEAARLAGFVHITFATQIARRASDVRAARHRARAAHAFANALVAALVRAARRRSLAALAVAAVAVSSARLVALRRALYRARHVCASQRLPVPVVVVGNITAGGVRQDAARRSRSPTRCAARGCHPGHRQPRLRRHATRRRARSRPAPIRRIVGDEPLLLARAGLPGVDRPRPRGRGARAARRASATST